ncbi:MAG: hypothetical protein ABII68_04320 [Pseudomonadota bacterium]
MPSTATSVEKSINIRIDHQCPQCGAPAVLEETDRLFTCEYCRVKSYMFQKDYFRYVLPNAAPEDKTLFFFPYWRFKGMIFSCVSDGIKHRFVDVSHQALESRCFPASVGLRSQALKLKFSTPETPGRFLKPTLPFAQVIQTFMQSFSELLPDPVFLQSHVGETLSLIYSPFYFRNSLYDGILNKPVARKLPDDFDVTAFPQERPGPSIRFIPTLCPQCGWDLHGERDATILTCSSCNSAWQPGVNRFKKVDFALMPGKTGDKIYLPFWRIKADVSEIALESYADLVKIANLPKAVHNSWHDIEFFFWSPGFKVRPKTFLNIARSMTLFQPRENLSDEIADTNLRPVTLPLADAVESLKITLASFIKPPLKLFPRLRDVRITLKKALLVYIPFTEKYSELVHPNFRMAINKNQLALGKHL